MASGSLCVPNVGLGDIEVRFNQHDSGERQKALRMLKDMAQRGYAILVKLDDGSYVRAVSIDAERGCYIVQLPEFDAQVAGTEPATDSPPEQVAGAVADAVDRLRSGLDDGPALPTKARRGRKVRTSIPIERAHAVGIARSAGG